MKIQQIVDNILNGTLNIPSFQRGFVWRHGRIAALMDSLYRGYPIGIVTTWKQAESSGAAVDMVVDGQQRMASIYACYTDTYPPTYGDSENKPRIGIHFHILDEQFDFPTPKTLNEDKMWVKVSSLFGDANSPTTRAWRVQIRNSPKFDEEQQDLYDERINRVKNIKDRDISFDQIESSRTTEEVVEMFDRINSNATTLKREELEIARISTKWQEAKQNIMAERDRCGTTLIRGAMREAAIIRSMHASYAGSYQREGLKAAGNNDLKQALKNTTDCNQIVTDLLEQKLGMYDPRAIKAVIAFPALTRYLRLKGKFTSQAEEAKALAYVLISNAWNIYRSGTDTMIDADVKLMQQQDAWERLEEITKTRMRMTEITVNPNGFQMIRTRPNRFYTLFHALTMRPQVRDWDSQLSLRSYKPNQLEQHHIFPRTHLQVKYNNDKKMVEDIANIAVISQDTNLRISDSPPEVYLKEIDDKDSQLLEAHCITRNRALWTMDKYPEFLEERRRLLSAAAQDFINNLLVGSMPNQS